MKVKDLRPGDWIEFSTSKFSKRLLVKSIDTACELIHCETPGGRPEVISFTFLETVVAINGKDARRLSP